MHQFRPGMLSINDAMALTELSRMVSGLSRMSVLPPLSLTTQGYDGQPVLTVDVPAPGPQWFFARLTTSTAPYSWVERIGAADGTTTGTLNAWPVQHNRLFLSNPIANDVVLMRARPTQPTVFEFLPVPYATPAVREVPTNFTITGTSGTFQTVDTYTLPSDGTYLLFATVTATLDANTVGSSIEARLSGGINFAIPRATVCYTQVANQLVQASVGISTVAHFAGSTVTLQAARLFSGTATATIIGGGGRTLTGYVRLG